MDLFDSMDYAIDYKVEDKEKTFIVDKEELFIALVDIRKQHGEVIRITDGRQRTEYDLNVICRAEKERIDSVYKYQKRWQKVYNTTEIYFNKLLKYEAITKREYKAYMQKLNKYKELYKDDLDKFKEKVKTLYII